MFINWWWIDKMCSLHIMKYYSAVIWCTDNSTTWMNLKNPRLIKRNQSQKSTILLFYLYEMPRRGKSIKIKYISENWRCDGLVGNRKWLLMSMGFDYGWWKLSKIDCLNGCTMLWIYYKSVSEVHNKMGELNGVRIAF